MEFHEGEPTINKSFNFKSVQPDLKQRLTFSRKLYP